MFHSKHKLMEQKLLLLAEHQLQLLLSEQVLEELLQFQEHLQDLVPEEHHSQHLPQVIWELLLLEQKEGRGYWTEE
jgi:hypothetical protein